MLIKPDDNLKSSGSENGSDVEDATSRKYVAERRLDNVNRDKDDDDKTLTTNKLADIITSKDDEEDNDDDHGVMERDVIDHRQSYNVSLKLPVKVLAENLQRFYNRKMTVATAEEPPTKGKPPSVPRKPIVTDGVAKRFVTKVEITEGFLSKEDKEAMDVLDKSIEMSERQPLGKSRNKGTETQSDNLIEEIVIPPVTQANSPQADPKESKKIREDFFRKETSSTTYSQYKTERTNEAMLAQRSQRLAMKEITSLASSTETFSSKIREEYQMETIKVEHPRACSSSSSTDSGTADCREPLIVAAIDLGTAYSGYAFSFTRDPETIQIMKKSESFWLHKYKQPTCVLLNPAGEFYSFGFNAQMNYHDLETSQEKRNWMYFDKFKMALHTSKNLALDTEIKAVNGMSVKAIVIFSHVLRYFKELVLDELTDSTGTKIKNEDVRWVITVPAIWRQTSKQFMRTAAYQAGLATHENPNQILIALEPEAASLFCRKLKLEQLVIDNSQFSPFSIDERSADDGTSGGSSPIRDLRDKTMAAVLSKGTRYMVVDCGGGTVDITVYEVENSNGNLRELHKATGGPYGSVGVDMQFEVLLRKIFGAEFLEKYKIEVPEGYVYLMLKFEGRKICAVTSMTKPLNIELPYTFIQAYQRHIGDQTSLDCLQKAVGNCGLDGVSFSSTGMLRLDPDVMLDLFRPTVTRIKQHIGQVLLQPRVRVVSYLFLVGGFAESQILQHEIRGEFSNSLTVIIPREVSVTILQGAVLYGLDPTIVSVRCSRLTYGVGVLNRFIPGVHLEEKRIVKDGCEWCTDVFDKFVTSNQSVGLGETVSRSYTPAMSGQKYLVMHIYSTEDENPMFITDRGVQRCGTLILDLRDTGRHDDVVNRNDVREIQTLMTFGDTEIKASAIDKMTSRCVGVDVDFLT